MALLLVDERIAKMVKERKKEGFSADVFFQTLFQFSPNAALVTRVCDGTIMHANDEFYRITGFSREEVIGKTTLELKLYFNPSDRTIFLSKMAKEGVLIHGDCICQFLLVRRL